MYKLLGKLKKDGADSWFVLMSRSVCNTTKEYGITNLENKNNH